MFTQSIDRFALLWLAALSCSALATLNGTTTFWAGRIGSVRAAYDTRKLLDSVRGRYGEY